MRKKLLALLLATVLVLALPAAGIALNVSEPGEFPIVDEPITLTVTTIQTPIQIDFNDIVILKEFEEKSGINIEWTCVPSDLRPERLNLMLASDDLPDILFKMQVSATDQAKYGDEGMLLPLSDYYSLMPNLLKWYDEFPSAQTAITQMDGNAYGSGYILAGYAIRMGSRYYFNTDLMDKVGYSAVPTTTDDLKEFLRKAKDCDYNENGVADEIPLSSSEIAPITDVLKGSFGLNNRGSSHTNVFIGENGELAYQYSSENYRQLLGYVRDLYAEGLLDQDIFTNDFAVLIAKAQEGRVLTYAFVNNTPVTNSKYEQYSLGMAEPFEGPNGDKLWGSYSLPASGTGNFVITHKCQYPEAAARWGDYWYSDEGIISYFMGVEGVTYEKDENAPGGLKLTDFVVNNPDGINFEQVLATYVPWAGGANPSVATNEFFKGGETWPVALDSAAGLIDYVPESVWPPFVYNTEESAEMSSILVDLEKYYFEWRANFIVGQKSLENDWDEYVNGFAGLKLNRYLEIYRGAMENYGLK